MQSQITGAAATTAYTLNSLAAAVWLFPASAAVLTWQLMGSRTDQWRAAASAAAAAALSASFTAIPYVEFDTASMPNMAAYGIAVPTMVLIVSALRHRDRIPLGVLALLGVFSVHITGGVVTVVFVVAWWLCDGLWHPVRSRLTDFIGLLSMAVPTVLLLLPQFLGVLQQAEIIVGHEFVTHEGKKRALFDAIVQHTRHLNDYPIQNALIALAAIGYSSWWCGGCGGRGDLAVDGLFDRALVRPVRRPARHDHANVHRSLLQRSAAAFRGGDAAARADGGYRAVHHHRVRRRPRPKAV